jgi:hypothetical protein
MFRTNGGHLYEETFDQFHAIVWAKDSGLAKLVVFLDGEFSQGHFWFFDRAVENRCSHENHCSPRDRSRSRSQEFTSCTLEGAIIRS